MRGHGLCSLSRFQRGKDEGPAFPDPRGVPLPFARVLLATDEHSAGLDPDGTQHLDHHTDADGRCLIARMSPFPVYASVRWAGRYESELWTPGEPLDITAD